MFSSNAVLFLGFLIYGCVNYASSTSCPDSDQISPCTCTVDSEGLAITVCNGMHSVTVIGEIFRNLPGWKIDSFRITNSSLMYIPSSILNSSKIDEFLVQDSTLISLFEQPPVAVMTDLKIINTKFLRGLDWNLFSRMRLDNLHIENTAVVRFGREFRDGVPKTLKKLDLIGVNLRKLANDSLVKLDQLQTLRILRNPLRNIDNLIFPTNVTLVDLSENQIQSLSDGIFNILPHRERLFILRNNSIKALKKEVFLEVNAFTQVYLGKYAREANPINCNCDIKWIITSGIDKKKISAACAEPKSLQGRFIEDLTASDFGYCM